MTPEEVPAELAEPAARAMHLEGAWCGVCEFDGWENCKECRETVLGYARHALAAVLPEYGAVAVEQARTALLSQAAMTNIDNRQFVIAINYAAAVLELEAKRHRITTTEGTPS